MPWPCQVCLSVLARRPGLRGVLVCLWAGGSICDASKRAKPSTVLFILRSVETELGSASVLWGVTWPLPQALSVEQMWGLPTPLIPVTTADWSARCP